MFTVFLFYESEEDFTSSSFGASYDMPISNMQTFCIEVKQPCNGYRFNILRFALL